MAFLLLYPLEGDFGVVIVDNPIVGLDGLQTGHCLQIKELQEIHGGALEGQHQGIPLPGHLEGQPQQLGLLKLAEVSLIHLIIID